MQTKEEVVDGTPVWNFGGVYLPAGESHLRGWMARKRQYYDGALTYQLGKLQRAISYIPFEERHRAVDIGAHVGLWSRVLAKEFTHLEAFEPVPLHCKIWPMNVKSENATLYQCALADWTTVETGTFVKMRTGKGSTGDTIVAENTTDAGDVTVQKLDIFLPDWDKVSFIKVDCEGFEYFILRGGEQLLRRDKPVIIVEQKPGRAQQFDLPETKAVTYLQGLGYKLKAHMAGDYILV